MKRRSIVSAAVGVTLGAAVPAFGQAKRVQRIGLLPDFGTGYRKALAEVFSESGWTEGTDYLFINSGLQGGMAQTAAAAEILLASKADLVLVVGTDNALRVQKLTLTVPVVMVVSGYPVEAGVANSLARPGRNVTGNTAYAGVGIWGKLLQLLQDAKPGIKRMGVFWTYVPPAFPIEEIEPCYQEFRQAAAKLGCALKIVEVSAPAQTGAALAKLEAEQPEGLVITSSSEFWSERQRIMQFALQRRLPTIVDTRWAAMEPYPLMCYGHLFSLQMRQAAQYVIRILKDGAKPGDLPIQLPARFELVLNLKTARAIGLTVPRALLLQATEVIE